MDTAHQSLPNAVAEATPGRPGNTSLSGVRTWTCCWHKATPFLETQLHRVRERQAQDHGAKGRHGSRGWEGGSEDTVPDRVTAQASGHQCISIDESHHVGGRGAEGGVSFPARPASGLGQAGKQNRGSMNCTNTGLCPGTQEPHVEALTPAQATLRGASAGRRFWAADISVISLRGDTK